MSTDAVAVLGFVALFALMLLRVPVGMAMGLVGVSGFGYLVVSWPAEGQRKVEEFVKTVISAVASAS
jgi:hypothetical protein